MLTASRTANITVVTLRSLSGSRHRSSVTTYRQQHRRDGRLPSRRERDGLLFELENGKPKLILLSRGVEKNAAKLSCRSRVANILSSRQPSCVEEVQGEEHPARQQAGRQRETKNKAGGAAASFASNNTTTTTGGRSTTVSSSKTLKVVAKGKSDRHKHGTTVGSLRGNGKTGQPQSSGTRAGGKVGLKDALVSGNAGLKDSVVCLTSEQLQQILNTVQTTSNGQDPPEDHRTQGNPADSKSGSSMNEGGRGKRKEEDRGGGEEIKRGEGGEGTDRPGSSQDKDNRLPGCLFSWLEERQSESRAAIDAKKAQWRRELAAAGSKLTLIKTLYTSCPAPHDGQTKLELVATLKLTVVSEKRSRTHPPNKRKCTSKPVAHLFEEISFHIEHALMTVDEQVAMKQQQQRSAPGRLQEVTPMEVLSVERKEEQKRRWLEELDQQREETTERRRREKLLQQQTEDHEHWASHFDSLQRRPPVQTAAPSAPPPALSNGSERGDWEPSSSLSLVWEAMSSCGAESVGGASVDTTSGYPTRTSYLRSMTALLDPAQIEERERRRLKQLEQQRAIEAQVEEKRRQREREEARRREEEEEEERRVVYDREMLEKRYGVDTQKEKQKEQQSYQDEQPNKGNNEKRHQENSEPVAVTRQGEGLEEVSSSASPYKHTAVQTEAVPSFPLRADRVQTPDVSAQYQPPPSLSSAPPNSRSRAVRTGKENICLPGGGGSRGGGGGDPYEAFARTEKSRRDKRRPEWNTQRPSRQFVPASERYPASLQRNRQESRMKRQAELLALQEKACLSKTNPPPQNQEPRLCSNPTQTRTSPTRKIGGLLVESVSRGHNVSAAVSTERGRSPPVPAVRHRVQSQQAPPSSTPPPPPPPVLEFIPYLRTDEVFKLDPLEPADTPPPHTHTEAPPQSSGSPPAPSHRDRLLHPELLRNTHTHRQQEILRGLAQLRQGLLQKQRELETDLNPLLKRHDNELR
uniref:Coiled-coil domain-containing protein 66 n=1 Tax=Dicentrarchus labrax TaxID=13489 RepID=E6ZGD7_DICLA|nr:Coiled-coil domain-containing protein 66 [Dicentrarchus labrax]